MTDTTMQLPGQSPPTQAPTPSHKPSVGTLAVFAALVLGILAGGFFPSDSHPVLYEAFRFCSRAFIALIKGLIVPLLLSTIIVGVAQTGDFKSIGRMGGKSLLYFEVVTTLALVVGLLVANLIRPGDGLPLALDAKLGETIATHPPSGWDIALHAFPSNLAKHAVEADILPVVVFAVIFGVSLVQIGDKGKPVLSFFEGVAETMFRYTGIVTKTTPIGVFGAMAYNVSHMAAGHTLDSGEVISGWSAVLYLIGRYAKLVGSMYFALILLVVFVFVPVAVIAKVPIRRFGAAVREPVVTAFSTATSEAALPRLLERMVELGVPRRVASFVIPAGYSFNLDGSTLYLVLASLAIAQAAKIEMPLSAQIAMVFVFMLTSKGVAGVPRATLVIIAATCHGFGLPGEAGVAMILAVDEIMDMGRTAINVLGNGLASVVVARWEGVFGEKPGESPGEPVAASSE